MTHLTLIAIATAAITATTVQANDKPGNPMRDRIRQGVRSGQLTKPEMQEIKQQRESNKAEMKAKRDEIKSKKAELSADGTLSLDDKKVLKEERQELKKMKIENRQEISKKVYDLKHNAETRTGTAPAVAAPAVPAVPAMPETPAVPSLPGTH